MNLPKPIHPFADGQIIIEMSACRLREEMNARELNGGDGVILATNAGIIFINKLVGRPSVMVPYSQIRSIAKKRNLIIGSKRLIVYVDNGEEYNFDVGKTAYKNIESIIQGGMASCEGDKFSEELINECIARAYALEQRLPFNHISKDMGGGATTTNQMNEELLGREEQELWARYNDVLDRGAIDFSNAVTDEAADVIESYSSFNFDIFLQDNARKINYRDIATIGKAFSSVAFQGYYLYLTKASGDGGTLDFPGAIDYEMFKKEFAARFKEDYPYSLPKAVLGVTIRSVQNAVSSLLDNVQSLSKLAPNSIYGCEEMLTSCFLAGYCVGEVEEEYRT
ncbi:MAG: hypothetical protein ACYC5A_01170 [Thermoleophilia bacterium]